MYSLVKLVWFDFIFGSISSIIELAQQNSWHFQKDVPLIFF